MWASRWAVGAVARLIAVFLGEHWMFSLFRGAVRWSGALWSSFAI
jgi:hypothetical protein